MLADEILVIHAVEVVAGQDDVLVAVGLVEEPKVLSHSVRGTLEPVLVDGALLRGENLDEALTVEGSDVAVVRLGQVSVEEAELNWVRQYTLLMSELMQLDTGMSMRR